MRPILHLDNIPWRSQPAYCAELQHLVMWGAFAGLVEGNISSVVAAKNFGASELLVTVVWATPMLANLLSLLWSVAARGRSPARSLVMLAGAACLCLSTVGLTPSDWHPWGGWLFAAQLAAARIFLAGVINVRASLWAANYPATHRATIAARLQRVRFIVGLVTGLAIVSLFDVHRELYRWVYPGIAAIGLISLIPIRRLGRSTRHRRRAERAAVKRNPIGDRGLLSGLREALAILRTDRQYARYLSAQYLLGSANLMVDPILAVIITHELHLSYLWSGVLLDHLPNIIMLMTMGLWAQYFDRVGVIRFRVWHTVVWTASFVLLGAGAALLGLSGSGTGLDGGGTGLHGAASGLNGAGTEIHAAASGLNGAGTELHGTASGMEGSGSGIGSGSGLGGSVAFWTVIGLLALSRTIAGLGRAGGTIAWNLGHFHFARPEQAELYMGLHVALTGLRGLIMPFVGLLAYQTLGWGCFLIAIALSVMACVAFYRMDAEADRGAG